MLTKPIALCAALFVAAAMWMIFVALVFPHAGPKETGFSVDRLRMADGCVGGQPVYYAPDGRLWTWTTGWRPVEPEARGACAIQVG